MSSSCAPDLGAALTWSLCRDCSRPVPEGHRCRRRTCSGYGHLWAGDQRRKLFVNLSHHQDGASQVALLTVTAPGADRLPWSDRCSPLGPHTCSGVLGCRTDHVVAAGWNASAPDRWRRLHRRAYAAARRLGFFPWLLVRVWELQHRGVLHVHPVLAYGTRGQKSAALVYQRELVRLAPEYGFGFVDRKLEVRSARAAAAYLSSYFVQGRGHKERLQESVRHPAMPRSIVHVSSRLTEATGCTMRRLRLHRYVFICSGASPLCEGDTWHVLDRYAVGAAGPRLVLPAEGGGPNAPPLLECSSADSVGRYSPAL